MKLARKILAMLMMLVAICGQINTAEAAEAYDMNYGNGYRASSNSPSLTPAIAVGIIAAVAVTAVVLSNNSGGHSAHSGHLGN